VEALSTAGYLTEEETAAYKEMLGSSSPCNVRHSKRRRRMLR